MIKKYSLQKCQVDALQHLPAESKRCTADPGAYPLFFETLHKVPDGAFTTNIDYDETTIMAGAFAQPLALQNIIKRYGGICTLNVFCQIPWHIVLEQMISRPLRCKLFMGSVEVDCFSLRRLSILIDGRVTDVILDAV